MYEWWIGWEGDEMDGEMVVGDQNKDFPSSVFKPKAKLLDGPPDDLLSITRSDFSTL